MKIIAHRGDTSKFPENTIEAFEAAKQNGADGIELDVHLTSDGKLVVHHDYYLGNPDNGHGVIPLLPLDAFASASIENTYHLPTLEEIFAKFGNTLHYELELKAFTEAAATQLVALTKKFNLTKNSEFTSPHPYILTTLKLINPSLTTGYFCPPRPEWMDPDLYKITSIANAKLGSINVIHYLPENIDEALVEAVQSEGMKVHVANCDSEADIRSAFTLHADQISTNQLAEAIGVKKQLSLR